MESFHRPALPLLATSPQASSQQPAGLTAAPRPAHLPLALAASKVTQRRHTQRSRRAPRRKARRLQQVALACAVGSHNGQQAAGGQGHLAGGSRGGQESGPGVAGDLLVGVVQLSSDEDCCVGVVCG